MTLETPTRSTPTPAPVRRTRGERKPVVEILPEDRFHLDAAFIESFRGRRVDWGPVGYLTFKRCVTTDTRVLTRDLRWIPAGEIPVGTEILAFEEFGRPRADGGEGRRRFETALVTHNEVELADCVEITLSDGTTLRSTADHPWLVRKAQSKLMWCEAKDLLRGRTKVAYFQRYFDVWDVDTSYEGGFLSAAFDGEGSLDRHRSLTFTQVDNPMLGRVREYLDRFGFEYTLKPKKTVDGRQQCYNLRLTGNDQVVRFLGMFRPPRLLARYLAMSDPMQVKRQRFRQKEDVRVVNVQPIGKLPVAVMSTSSRTHFTAGFPSHNTYARPLADGKTEEWWQTVRRVVEGVFTIQRWHTRRKRRAWNPKLAQRSAQEMYRLIFEMKMLPPGRGLWAMGTDHLEKFGSSSLYNCLARETEVITADGIKQIGDLAGTSPTILTRGGKWVEAPVQSFGVQPLMKVTLERQGVEKVIFATAGHRWFAHDRRAAYRGREFSEFTTEQLRPGVHRLQSMFGEGIKSPHLRPSPIGIAHGITYGDGSRIRGRRNSNHVMLCGAKDRELLPYFAGHPTKEHPKVSSGGAVRVSNLPNFFKDLPSLGETKSYLYGWLAGYFAADGSVHTSGAALLSSTNRANLEFVRDLCAAIGIGTYSIRHQDRISNLTNRPSRIFTIGLVRSTLVPSFFLLSEHRRRFEENPEPALRHWNVKAVEASDRVEEVFCATVESEEAFTLADNILTGNCTMVSSDDPDFSRPYVYVMDMSMLGVGCGFDTTGAGQRIIRKPRLGSDVHVVEDSREGWIKIVKRTLDAYVGKGALPASVDYSLVRPAGSPIKTFGGVAAGPDPLIRCIDQINAILTPLIGHKMTSSAIVDLMNIIGVCVVSGNVRRSAEIALGDPSDREFMSLKDPELHQAELMSHRWASNNSVFATIGMDYHKTAELTAKNGEPGYIWLDNGRNFGRMGDPRNVRADARVRGVNPCSEIFLESYEVCNLAETFPSRHSTYAEYENTLRFALLYCKTVTLLPTHVPETNRVQKRNRRIGVSQSGIVQSMQRHGRRTHLEWSDRGYRFLRELDVRLSGWLDVPQSIKLSTVKPSGSVSLLPGVTPGIHFEHSEFYWRTIRVAKTSQLLGSLTKAGYRIEEDLYDPSGVVVYFPIKAEYFDRAKDDVTMWEQLELAAQMGERWADNAVSVTITFKPHEAKDIAKALELYETRLKAVSFLPLVEHGYVQAPYQTITREEYEEAAGRLRRFNLSGDTHDVDDAFCDGDKCLVPGVDPETGEIDEAHPIAIQILE